jgi:hypothetical protein
VSGGPPPRSLRDDAARARGRVLASIDAHPFPSVLAAVCVGFALGGGVPRGTAALLLGVGARAAGSRLGDFIVQNAPTRAAQENVG